MDIKQLEAFVQVVEAGSFSRAAERLFLSQPTVSVHVQSLEESLGTRLLDRLGKEVVPTPAGEILYRYARRILALRDRAVQDIHHFLGELAGSFEIAASTIPGEYLLPPVLAEFQRRHPKVKVSLCISDTGKVIKEVGRGTCLLGVVGGKVDEKGLSFVALREEELVLALCSSHPLAQTEKVDLRDLESIPLILREEGSGTRRTFEEALRQVGKNLAALPVVAELGSTTALKEGVKACIGAAIISPRAVKDEVHCGIIKTFKIRGLNLRRRFYLVRRSKRTLPPPVEELESFILSSLATGS
ncbi:MAG: LysR family transcriptional regulator [Aquificota bacterium]|nr:MAG: LysR family transcriptional regulator [Aquificota bacterium]